MAHRVTMCLKQTTGSVTSVEHFVGKRVKEQDSKSVYHSLREETNEIKAVSFIGDDAYLLRDDEKQECNATASLVWESPLELQMFAISIENGENYVVIMGIINRKICIGESDNARIYMEGDDDTVIFLNKKNGRWVFSDVLGSYAYSESYPVESSVAEDFTSGSEFLKVGLNERPDNIHSVED